jgi:hypothetical protein
MSRAASPLAQAPKGPAKEKRSAVSLGKRVTHLPGPPPMSWLGARSERAPTAARRMGPNSTAPTPAASALSSTTGSHASASGK